MTANVWQRRSDKATGRPERGFSMTICIPGAGAANAMLVNVPDWMLALPRRHSSRSLISPFFALASCPASPDGEQVGSGGDRTRCLVCWEEDMFQFGGFDWVGGGLGYCEGVAWPVKGYVVKGGCVPSRVEVFFDEGHGCVRGFCIIKYNLSFVDVL